VVVAVDVRVVVSVAVVPVHLADVGPNRRRRKTSLTPAPAHISCARRV
jgi:hypothetical protein